MGRHHALVRYPPTSASVREARRFTTDWAHAEGVDRVADDAALVVSELASNAVLHARTDFEVHLLARGSGLRVEVWDCSSTMPLSGTLDDGATSGRGLPLVHALAQEWGVRPVAEGKCVWAQITESATEVGEDVTAEALMDMWATLGEEEPAPAAPEPGKDVAAPERTVTVVVPDLPGPLLLAAKTSMDDLLRELQLVLLHGGEEASAAVAAVMPLAQRLDAAARDFDSARLQIRGQALRAAEQGELRVTLELRLPVDSLDAALRYRDAVGEAAVLSRSGRLLAHVEALTRYSGLRRLYLDSIIDQLTAAAA